MIAGIPKTENWLLTQPAKAERTASARSAGVIVCAIAAKGIDRTTTIKTRRMIRAPNRFDPLCIRAIHSTGRRDENNRD
jgi:hypothetical protein